MRVDNLLSCIKETVSHCTRLAAEPVQNQRLQSKFPPLSVRFLSSISTRPVITRTFEINSVIVVAISNILSAIYLNSENIMAVPPVAMEGYSLNLIIFTGATPQPNVNMVATSK